MNKTIMAVIFLLGAGLASAENYNSISVQGQLDPVQNISDVNVHILADSAIVGTASDVDLLPDASGYFSVFLRDITPADLFRSTNTAYDVRFSTGGYEIATAPLTSVPFAKALKGESVTDNVIAAVGNIGVGITTPKYLLQVSSVAAGTDTLFAVSTGTGGSFDPFRVTGQGDVYAAKYYGDGSSLTGLSGGYGDNLGNHVATNALDMSNYGIINVSSIVFPSQGIVIGDTNNSENYEYGIGIGYNAYSNYSFGVGIGYNALNNYSGGVGVGYRANENSVSGVGVGSWASYNEAGVGVGAGASSNWSGVGVGYDAKNNFNHGVGIGYFASGNSNHAIGIGAYSQNSQPYGSALGAYSYAASSSVALGANSKANATKSISVGVGTINDSTGTASFGLYAITTSSNVTAAKYYGDGSALTGISPIGDNLGDHIATTTLQMGAYGINTSSDITAGRYQIGGFTILARLPGSGIGIGDNAGWVNTGELNTFVGHGAGGSNTTGHLNVSMGDQAGFLNTTGSANTILGWDAGRNNTTGDYLVFVGAQAGYSNTAGSFNTFIGQNAGLYNETGLYNIFVGNWAGEETRTGSGNIVLGVAQDVSGPNASDELNIGGVLFGNLSNKTIGISTRAPQAALDVVSTGTAADQMAQIWRASDGSIQSSMSATGVMMAEKFVGDGSGLTGLVIDNIPAEGVLPGTLGNGVIASSIAVGSIYSAAILDGAVNNAKIAESAGITYSKLTLTNSIVNADIAAGAAISYGKLDLAGSIANSDLAGSISDDKLSQITTADKVAAAAIANGSLGALVMVSSVAAGSVYPEALQAGTYGINITGNATDSTKVAKTGDTMTGTLTLANNSTMTITGNAFSVGGSTLVVANGNVGIGTTNPGVSLDVRTPTQGAAHFQNTAASNSSVVTIGQLNAGGNDASQGLFIDVRGAGSALDIYNNTTSVFRVKNNGNVGIGTANPVSTLTVNGEIRQIGSSNRYQYWYGAAGVKPYMVLNEYGVADWHIGVGHPTNTLSITKTLDGTDGIIIGNTGNVGIGTASPATKLDVNGDLKANTFYSATTDTSCSNAVPANVYSLPSDYKVHYYAVYVRIEDGTADTANYSAYMLVAADSTSRVLQQVNGGRLTIALSGLNIWVTQTSGLTLTVKTNVIRYL